LKILGEVKPAYKLFVLEESSFIKEGRDVGFGYVRNSIEILGSNVLSDYFHCDHLLNHIKFLR
jgi:hypothetical protein